MLMEMKTIVVERASMAMMDGGEAQFRHVTSAPGSRGSTGFPISTAGIMHQHK